MSEPLPPSSHKSSPDSSYHEDGFVMVINKLLDDPEVTCLELRIVMLIGKYQTNGFYGSLGYLASICNATTRTIRSTIRSLEKKRLIIGIPRPGRTTLYRAIRTSKGFLLRPDKETFDALQNGGVPRKLKTGGAEIKDRGTPEARDLRTIKGFNSKNLTIGDSKIFKSSTSSENGNGGTTESWTQPSETVRSILDRITQRSSES